MRNQRSSPPTVAEVDAFRAVAAAVEPDLAAGLTHRDGSVRSLAAKVAREATAVTTPHVGGEDKRFYSDAARRLMLARFLSTDATAARLWEAISADSNAIDLGPAVQAWPDLPAYKRGEVLQLLHSLGPDTPRADDLIVLGGRHLKQEPMGEEGYYVLNQLNNIAHDWFDPAQFEYHRTSGWRPHWRQPQDRDVIDPASAVSAMGGLSYAGLPTAGAVTVLSRFGPRVPLLARPYLPALDAEAARATSAAMRDRAATAARAIRDANGLPQPSTQPAP